MSLHRLRTAAVAAALFAGLGLTAVATEASATTNPPNEIRLTDPGHPMAGESFLMVGTLASRVHRQIELDRRAHGTWKRIANGWTDEFGAFNFELSTPNARTYRVLAHTVTIEGTTYHSQVTPSRKITPVAQTARLRASRSSVRSGQTLTLTLEFTPVRPGRLVYVRALGQEGSVRGVENTHGHFIFDVPPYEGGHAGTFKFQAVAPAWNGAATIRSKTVTVKLVG